MMTFDTHGNLITNEKYTEIIQLHNMLEKAEIPHSFGKLYDGYQVIYPNIESRIADAIEHSGSYGEKENLLEIMGLLTEEELEEDSVAGYLTAKDVFKRMEKDWRKRQ